MEAKTTDQLWGGETSKAVENFQISGHPIPAPVVHWMGRIKAAAARANAELGELDTDLAERIARVPEPSVRLNKAVTCYGLLAMGLGAGMLMNVPLSNLAHSSYDAHRGQLLDAAASGGLKAFLEARDGAFFPEPFGPKSASGTKSSG